MAAKPVPADVDAYIAAASSEARPTLTALRRLIRATVPDATEGISYGVPFYQRHGQLAGFAAYRRHVSFGPAGDPLAPADRELLEQGGYKTGTQTVQIRFDQEVPASVIERLLRVRAAELEAGRAGS
jgi:uncharacterized protein YdhG (YjbR/CyaY superfamily)